MESTRKVDRFNGVVVTTPETTYPLTLLKMEFNKWHFREEYRLGEWTGRKSQGCEKNKNMYECMWASRTKVAKKSPKEFQEKSCGNTS